MILKVLPAFGWLVLKDSFDAGEVFSNELFTENVYTVHNPSPYSDGRFGNTLCGYQWLYTEGRVRHTNVSRIRNTLVSARGREERCPMALSCFWLAALC